MRSGLLLLCVRSALLTLLAVLAVGCGGARNKVVPVEGRIRFSDGKALPAGTQLVFNPVEGRTGTAVGITSEDGSFKLTHVTTGEGAEVGKYSVLLKAPQGDSGSFYTIVPKDYWDVGVFAIEVKEGMAPLELKVAKKK
jgi:hypothetical protein